MSRREPFAVRLYRRAAWTVGDHENTAPGFAGPDAPQRAAAHSGTMYRLIAHCR